jgi:hypothetical protein
MEVIGQRDEGVALTKEMRLWAADERREAGARNAAERAEKVRIRNEQRLVDLVDEWAAEARRHTNENRWEAGARALERAAMFARRLAAPTA